MARVVDVGKSRCERASERASARGMRERERERECVRVSRSRVPLRLALALALAPKLNAFVEQPALVLAWSLGRQTPVPYESRKLLQLLPNQGSPSEPVLASATSASTCRNYNPDERRERGVDGENHPLLPGYRASTALRLGLVGIALISYENSLCNFLLLLLSARRLRAYRALSRISSARLDSQAPSRATTYYVDYLPM